MRTLLVSCRCLVDLILLVVGASEGEYSRIILRAWETTAVDSPATASGFSTTAVGSPATASGFSKTAA